MMQYSFIGSKEKIQRELQVFVNKTVLDEVMVAAHIYDTEAKKRSLQIVSELFRMAK
jgi:hypothetical protein